MNRVYNALMKKIQKEAKDALKSSQKSWIKHRDEEYKFIGSAFTLDGSMWSNVRMEESLNVVRARTLVLEGYLELLKDID